MRQTKFRMWDKTTSIMWSWDDIGRKEIEGELSVHSLLDGQYANLIPMQYVELQDKNGKEIYEGDKYKIDDQIYIVVFDDGAFWSEWIPNKSRALLYGHTHVSEVIGNIYENPELLKEEPQ